MTTLPDAFASLRISLGCEVVSPHHGATEGGLTSKGQAAIGGAGHREGDDSIYGFKKATHSVEKLHCLQQQDGKT